MKKVNMKKCISTMVSVVMLCSGMTALAQTDINNDIRQTDKYMYSDAVDTVPSGWLKTDNGNPTGGSEPAATYVKMRSIPQMESGKAAVTGSEWGKKLNLYKNLENTINLTGSHNVYHISWNEYLSPNDQAYADSVDRGPQLRFGLEGTPATMIRAGIMNSSDGSWVPGLRIQDQWCYAAGTKALQTGRWYHMELCIAVNTSVDKDTYTLKCYEYGTDGNDAETLKLEPAAERYVNAQYTSIMTYTYDLTSVDVAGTGFHGFSDIKMTTYKIGSSDMDTQTKIIGLIDLADEFTPAFGGVNTLTDTSASPATFNVKSADDINNIEAPSGMNLSWKSSDESAILFDECGREATIKASSDKNLCLTAVLTSQDGGYVTEKSFPVTVIVPSVSVTQADLASYADGTKISATGAQHGWAGGYTAADGFEDGEIIKNAYGSYIPITKVEEDVSELTRTLETPLDMDSDAVYYIRWSNELNETSQWSYNKLLFNGDAADKEFSVTSILTAENDPELVVKTPGGSRYTLPDLKLRRFYNYVMRIDTSSGGKDSIKIKAYPAGMAEPSEWDAEYEENLSDNINSLSWDIGKGAAATSYIGDVIIDRISKADAATFEDLEKNVNSADSEKSAQAIAQNAPIDGAWKMSLLEMAKAKKELLVEDVSFTRDGISDGVITAGDVVPSLKLKNNTSADMTCTVIAGVYNSNGILTNTVISPVNSIKAGNSSEFTFDTVKAVEGTYIKLYCLDSLNTILPLRNAISVDNAILICK